MTAHERREAVPAVSIRGLYKRFGRKVAVDAIDLDVPPGSFFGLLGPNGAGKTTTLRMVTGLQRPDAGQVLIEGVDAWEKPAAVKAIVGVLPEEAQLFERLSGNELLTYNGLLRGMPADLIESRARQLLEVLDLEGAAATLVIDYSHGMRKKIGLACALLHGPRILFLDEPFEGVDAVASRTIRAVLDRFTRSGGTVVLSSHVLPVVEQLCDHVAVMHQGRIVAQGGTQELRAERSLEDVFVELVGAGHAGETTLSWLGSSSV